MKTLFSIYFLKEYEMVPSLWKIEQINILNGAIFLENWTDKPGRFR